MAGNGDRWYYSYLPMGIAGGATSPLVALYAFRVFHASLVEVGLLSSLTSLASVPAYILWGHLSDSSGRRKLFLLLGFVGMAATLLMMGLSRTLGYYYVANVLNGFLTAASGPVGIVLIMETSRKEEWADKVATFSRIGGLGWVAGLLLGALWLQSEALPPPLNFPGDKAMQGLFIISTALSLLSTLLAWVWLREPERRVLRQRVDIETHHLMVLERARYLPTRILHVMNPFNHHILEAGKGAKAKHPLPRGLWYYFVAVGLFFSGFTAFYGIFPVFLASPQVFGYNPSANTYIFLIYIASQMTQVASYPRVARWVKGWGNRRSQLVATAGRAALFPSFLLATLPMPFLGLLALVLALHAFVGLCWALVNVSGTNIVSALSPAEARGEAQGIFNAVQGVGAIVGPIIGGLVAEALGFTWSFGVASLFLLAGICVTLFLRGIDG